jgi:signal transduction histidine kinase
VRVADRDAPPALLIDVTDSGGGIPPALAARLFTRGARGGDAKRGHGLGLYIVKRVMSLHGGAVEMVRTGPEGTTMRLAISQADGDGSHGTADQIDFSVAQQA